MTKNRSIVMGGTTDHNLSLAISIRVLRKKRKINVFKQTSFVFLFFFAANKEDENADVVEAEAASFAPAIAAEVGVEVEAEAAPLEAAVLTPLLLWELAMLLVGDSAPPPPPSLLIFCLKCLCSRYSTSDLALLALFSSGVVGVGPAPDSWPWPLPPTPAEVKTEGLLMATPAAELLLLLTAWAMRSRSCCGRCRSCCCSWSGGAEKDTGRAPPPLLLLLLLPPPPSLPLLLFLSEFESSVAGDLVAANIALVSCDQLRLAAVGGPS